MSNPTRDNQTLDQGLGSAPEKDAAGEKKKKKPGKPAAEKAPIKETGGPKGPEPTRYGDWESKGRAIDF